MADNNVLLATLLALVTSLIAWVEVNFFKDDFWVQVHGATTYRQVWSLRTIWLQPTFKNTAKSHHGIGLRMPIS